MPKHTSHILFSGSILFALTTWFAQVESDSRSPRRTPAWVADTPGVDSTRRTSSLSDSLKRQKQGPSLHYRDRYGDPYSDRPFDSPLRLKDPANVKTEIQVDTGGNVTIQEKVGAFDYRPPTTLNREEFSSYQDGFLSREYWRSKAEGEKGKSEVTGRRLIPKIYLGPTADRLFGGSYLDFQTNGFVTLDFGAQWQRTANPNLPVRQQRQFLPLNFDQQMSINFTGKLGEKLKMTGNFDSKASFQFEQNLKLEYTGFEEDIIQKIEAGNVSMPLNSTLITGAQNLFGLKTQLRFGRLQVTSILANQRARLDEVRLQGGAQRRRFEIRASDYEENRHFLLGQFFRNNYEPALRTIPVTGGYSPRSSGTIPATANNTINNANNPNGPDPSMGGGDFGGGMDGMGGGMNGANGMNNGMINGNQNSIGGSSVNSGVNITRIEVYVTNRANNTQTLRNLVAFTDLGEGAPFRNFPVIGDGLGARAPVDNAANGLYRNVENDPQIRNADLANGRARELGLEQGVDFEILRGARQLSPQEYTFQPQLGYISLNTPIGRDEIIAVAFEYTLNGRRYKVGELTEDYQTRNERETILLKLIRPAAVRTNLPTWDLMMKNIYSLGAGQINREGFQLRVIYKDDLTGIDNPSLQEGRYTKDVPLLQVFNLDRLNPQGDPQPDGNFDWVEGVTIDSRAGRIIFPVLEPFGSHLTNDDGRTTTPPPPPWFDPQTEQALISKYVFDTLYASTRNDAQQVAEKNKFFLKGTYQGTASNDVQLPTFGADAGAVTVTRGGIPLVQGQDYILENGEVKFLDESINQSNSDVVISYEKPDLFNNQIRTLMGTRLDYLINKDFVIGSTLMRLKERPIISRVGMGNEPTNNTVLGFDANFKKDSRFLTRLVDKLPLIQTKELSGITFTGEYARLFPGVAPGARGNSFIDDFEGAETPFDLTRIPQVNWKLGATPLLFPEATAPRDSLQYSYRRAKIAWYTVDNTFNTRSGRPGGLTDQDLQNHFVRQVLPQEIFPARDRQQVNLNENLMNIAYYPAERGMYNYNPTATAQGRLPNDPRQNWAALTRAIRSDIDFDNANVQYIEFWMMDPFLEGQTRSDRNLIQQAIPGVSPEIYAQDNQGGDLYFNLGNISEDVLKDERHAFENGLPVNDDPNTRAAATNWGQVPGTQFLTNAFENTTGARGRQDVGLDGLTNAEEKAKYSDRPNLANLEDPSGDDFAYFLDSRFEAANTKLLDRYKDFNGMEGNSPEAGGSDIARSATTYPDNEDLNQDNTVSNLESYYQYKISLRPGTMKVGANYIVAKRDTTIGTDRITWYQFRIPVREYTEKVGNIENFKSIRFMRMFLTNWQEPVVLRLAQYQLVANQWRTYSFSLEETKLQQPVEPSAGGFTLGTVNIEENSGSTNPVPYQIPPGFIRDRDITTINNRLLNEQSLRLCVDELRDGDARAAFKTTTLDFINYKRIRMFLHAETGDRYQTADNEVTGFLRLGTDYTENYYEIEKTLVITPDRTQSGGRLTPEQVWPEDNEIDFPFQELVRVKSERNKRGISVLVPYEETFQVEHSNGNRWQYRVRVVGNPDLSSVQIIMLGVRNPTTPGAAQPKSVCIWANELRVTDFDQEAGWAATGRLNLKLADFATVSASGRHTTYGFGGIQDRISERARENTTRWDATANINLDKLLPAQLGLKVPLFVGYERERIRPRFNPLDPDVELEQSIRSRFNNRTVGEEREYRKIVEDNTTRRSFNFSNIQKVRLNPDAKPHLWDIENWSLSYAYSDIVTTNVTTAQYLQKNQRGGLAYAFTTQPKFIEPFKNLKFLDNPWTKWLQEFNFALTPSSVGVRGDLDRSFTKTQYRNSDLTTRGIAPLYEKFFTFNRLYDLRWNLARNLSLDYTATANAVIDEPRGDIDDTEINPLTDSLLLGSGYTKRDSVLANIKRLGRMKQFQQRASLTYRLPFDKFVLTDWLNADVRYGAGYQWTASPVGVTDTLGLSFGNIAQNNRERAVNGQINLTRLYNKVKFLKEINEAKPPAARQSDSTRPQAPERPRIAVQDTARKKPEFKILKGVLRALMTARSLNFNFQIDETTLLPGLLTQPKYFGVDESTLEPGLGFALAGSQDAGVRKRLAEPGLYSKSNQLNNPFVQTYTESFSARTDLEPFRDFKIRLDVKRNHSQYYTELFRSAIDSARYDQISGAFLESYQSQSPNLSGDYNISFLSIKTFFRGGRGGSSPVFEQFDTNRYAIQNRLQIMNGENGSYDVNAQDVLIPAFLAAYSGKDVNKVGLTPFPKIPLPNWRVDYAGLSRLEAFRKIFSSFNLQHSYQSSYSVRNFISSLEYTDPADVGLNPRLRYPTASLTSDSGYVPVYVMSQVVISERFAPLIGIEARTLSRITARLQYNAERIMVLNLSNRQVQELNSRDITASVGFTRNNTRLPFKTQGRNVVLKNDLQFRCDATVRDTKTIQRKLEGGNTITAGGLNFQFKPTVNYVVNQRLNVQGYFERTVNGPYISTSFRRSTTSFGVNLRYSLSE